MNSLNTSSHTGDLVLVIDQGGHATRASTVDQYGQVHSRATTAISATHDAVGHIEYNPYTMLQSLQQSINDAVKDIPGGRIRLAGLATQRSNVICWHRGSGEPLSPIISWQDRRAANWLKQKKSYAQTVKQQTGLLLSPHYGASKLNWCLKHIPAVQQASKTGQLTWGPMASWLTRQLCQESPFVCDAVNASRTLLWSLQDSNWSTDLIQLFELDKVQLPSCVPNDFRFGTLALTNAEIPLQLVTGDQAAALFANGIPKTNRIYITVGTGAFLLSRCDQPTPADHQGLLTSVIHQRGESTQYAYEGTVNGAGSALDYYSRQFELDDYISMLPQWLDDITNPPLFINGHAGLGTPYMRAELKSRFIGDGEKPDHMVAIIESIIFLLQLNIAIIRDLQPCVSTIQIGGGLSRLDGFCQRLADMGLPVIRTEQTETTSHGLANLLFDQLGIECRPETRDSQTFIPQHNPALRHRFEHWQLAMKNALDND